MSRTWFTSDTHYGHANILHYCNRPFATVEEMDASLVANWNAVVGPDDDVWHLGDFCMGGAEAAAGYLRRLHGRVHLVWGNHDRSEVRGMTGWASSQAMMEVTVEGTRIVLLHYAMRVWPCSHHGTLHFYGHSHGTLPGDSQSSDVGVDNPAWGYRPVGLAEIRRHMRTLPERAPPDRHGACSRLQAPGQKIPAGTAPGGNSHGSSRSHPAVRPRRHQVGGEDGAEAGLDRHEVRDEARR